MNKYRIKFTDIPLTDDRILYEYFVSMNEALRAIQSALNDIDSRLSKLEV